MTISEAERAPNWFDRRRSRRAAKKARRRAARPAQRVATILPPEGAPLTFPIADLGARFAAQLADLALTYGAAIALTMLLVALRVLPWEMLSIFSNLLFFAIRIPYYIWAEIRWNGRTLGKRISGIRVVSADGRTLTPHAVAVRNFMKEVEVFSPALYLILSPSLSWFWAGVVWLWIIILLAVPLIDRRRRRIGDIIANTIVIQNPKLTLDADMARETTEARFVFLPNQLDHYGRHELQTLEQILRTPDTGMTKSAEEARRRTLEAVTAKVRAKIDYPEPVAAADRQAFLQAFYTAQRAHLESRKLFGDAREDKFYKDESKDQWP